MSTISPKERLALLKNNVIVAISEYLDYHHNPVDTVSIEILEAELRRHTAIYKEAKRKYNLLE